MEYGFIDLVVDLDHCVGTRNRVFPKMFFEFRKKKSKMHLVALLT